MVHTVFLSEKITKCPINTPEKSKICEKII